jgi:hypothetical protein
MDIVDDVVEVFKTLILPPLVDVEDSGVDVGMWPVDDVEVVDMNIVDVPRFTDVVEFFKTPMLLLLGLTAGVDVEDAGVGVGMRPVKSNRGIPVELSCR